MNFSKGDKVKLGDGQEGTIQSEVSRQGFHGYRVKITKSVDPEQIGRTVGATADGLKKISSKNMKKTCIRLGNLLIDCDVAQTPSEQRLGLQVYASLDEGEGLLFPYSSPKTVSFHMGNVSFPIDIIGIQFKKISHIIEDIQPGNPEIWVFRNITAVLEVPGGFCKKYEIDLDTEVEEIDEETEKESQAKSYNLLRNITEAQISNPQWENYIEPTVYPDQDLPPGGSNEPFQGPPAKRVIKPKDQWKDRQDPSEFLPDEPKQYENYGYTPLEETEVAVRPSASKLLKLSQIILKIHPDYLNNLVNEWEIFKSSPVGQASVKMAECYEKCQSQDEIETNWQNLTASMTVWDIDAVIHGLVSVGYDRAVDLLKVSKIAQKGEEYEIGGEVTLNPRGKDTYDGLRANEIGKVTDIQDNLIAVKFETYPVVKWIDKLDLNAVPPKMEEQFQDINFGK